MNCFHCGAGAPDDAKFCPTCGRDLAAAAAQREPAADGSPEKKKKALWKKLLIGFGGFAGVVAVIVMLVFMLTASLVETVERQLNALKRGNIDAAYAETSIAFREATNRERFETFVTKNKVLGTFKSYSFPSRSYNNNIGTVKGTLKTADGGVFPVRFQLVKENGAWKIRYIDLSGK
jgi:hypothetical protein